MQTSLHNEKELLAAIAEGDQSAFTTLFDHYQRYIYSIAFRLTANEQLSEEIVQDVFLKIWLKRTMLPEIIFFPAFFV